MTPEDTKPAMPKRFYSAVRVQEISGVDEPSWSILLDERPAKSPSGNVLTARFKPLADAIGTEWEAQTDEIDIRSMTMTRHQMSVLDGPTRFKDWRQEILAFLEHDLLCYRADRPACLAMRQKEVWDPLLKAAASRFSVALVSTEGIASVAQSAVSLAAARDRLDDIAPEHLLVVRRLTELTGSAVLALLAEDGLMSGPSLQEAAFVDEDFQIAQWGSDAEATARRERIVNDITEALRFRTLCA